MTKSDDLRRDIRNSVHSIAFIAAQAAIPRTTLYSFVSGQTDQLRGDAQIAVRRVLERLGEKGVTEDSTPFDHELRVEAESYGLDPDSIAKKAVEDAVKRKRIDAWIEENREAMEANAKDLRENGLWSDGLRQF